MTAPIPNATMLAARIDLEIKALRIVIERLELCKSFLAPPTAEQVVDPQAGWPAHLRDDAPSRRCSLCGRSTWDTEAFGTLCKMLQPNGDRCMGLFMPAGGAA